LRALTRTWFGLPVLLARGLGIALMVDASFAYGQSAAPEEAAPAILPRDLTPYGMFMSADVIVKAVMVGLMFGSVTAHYRALYAEPTSRFSPSSAATSARGRLTKLSYLIGGDLTPQNRRRSKP